MRYYILFFYLTFLTTVTAQWVPSLLTVDTVKISDRLGGRLDSLDVFFPSLTTHPNSWNGNSIYAPIFLLYQPGGLRTLNQDFKTTYSYSGLPHIGFGYSFGTKGLQSSRMEYQQVFAKRLLVNLSYTNNRANGFLRNQDLKFNNIELGLLKKGSFFSFEFNAFERNLDNALNGGIGPGADLETFPMIFQPVRKNDAREFIRNSGLQLNNFFDLQKDTIKSFGLMTKSEVMVRSRRFEEFDTLWGFYPEINIDSLQTFDRYQWSTLTQGAGIFYRDQNLYANFRVDGKYWKYYNMGMNHDTLEVSVASNIEYFKNRLNIGQKGFFNLNGAGNEWRSEQYIKYRLKFLQLFSSISVEQRWPDVFQRHYFSNNFSIVAASDYQLQFRLGVLNQIVYDKFRLPVLVTHSTVHLKNNYFWYGQGWSSSLFSSVSAHQIALATRYEVGILSLNPKYTASFVKGMTQFLPKHQFDLRLSISGGIFKARKPKAYAGVDIKWQSSMELIDFLPVLSVYQFAPDPDVTSSFFNLHAFAGFEIDEFRFFVRYENIGYLWNEPTLELLKGYPFPSGHLRFGLTWDFFN